MRPESSNSGSENSTLLLWVSVVIFVLCYLGTAIRSAAGTPLWMDEVLAVWTVRLPSVSAIYAALAHGAEFSPPVYHVALHYFSRLAGGSNLALRLPSIAAALLTGLCTFVIVRRYQGAAAAAFSCCLLLKILFPFAEQVRPYALATCCFAIALLLWDDLNRNESRWRCAAIALLLALAVSLHFYSVLLVVCLGLMELIRLFRTSKFRLPVWLVLFAGGASIIIWLPLLHTMSQYNAGDTGSPAYYAKPTLVRLFWAYFDLTFQGRVNLILIGISAIVALTGGLLKFRGHADARNSAASAGIPGKDNFFILIVSTSLLPLIAYIFSLVVTKTFNLRYANAASIGLCALIAAAFAGFPLFRRTVPFIVLLASVLILRYHSYQYEALDQAAVFQQLPGKDPIVIADGLQFFPLMESAPPGIRSRLFYLTVPDDVKSGDPTNEHQIERWKTIDPTLPVEDVSEFLGSHSEFYVIDAKSSDDTPATYLLDKHAIELSGHAGGALIYKSRHPSTTGTR